MDKTIFVVDDSHTNLFAAEEALEELYNVITVPSGAKTITLLEKIKPDLILLDIEMPEMDGFEVLKFLKSQDRFKEIPVIFLTSLVDTDVEVKGFQMGVVDFIIKPFSAPVLINRVKLHLSTSDLIIRRTAQLLQAHQNMIYILADMIETRDECTGGHVERTAAFMKLLITCLQEEGIYSDEVVNWDADLVSESAMIHDIGKINISDTILNKPGRLTPEEYEIMKTHAMIGRRIIDRIADRAGESEFLTHARAFVAYHHERWDGSGYPYGLAGEDIPINGRLMALVDVYDALLSERPYKKAFSYEDALRIIVEDSGKHFDPKIVEIFRQKNDLFIQAHLDSKKNM